MRPFADVNGGRWQVSAGGGFQPLWSPDGREMFYRDLTGAVMRVAIERGPGWAAGTPTKVFGAGQYYFGYGEAFGRTYDISRDGRRFLMIKDVARDQSSAPTILVVQNWFEELKAHVPTKYPRASWSFVLKTVILTAAGRSCCTGPRLFARRAR